MGWGSGEAEVLDMRRMQVYRLRRLWGALAEPPKWVIECFKCRYDWPIFGEWGTAYLSAEKHAHICEGKYDNR